MNIKQLSLIALLAAPALTQAQFSQDDLIHAGSISALIGSPCLAVWSIYQAHKNIAKRDAIEASIPGLTQALEQARIDAEKLEKELKLKTPICVDKPAVYQKFISPESSIYQDLMLATYKGRCAVATVLASIAAGALSWSILHPAEAEAVLAPVIDLP